METEGRAPEGSSADHEVTMEELLKEQATFRQRLDNHEIVWVKVVQVQEKGVMVDIGEKHEGIIPSADFVAESMPAAGSRIPVVLISRGRDDHPAQLSHKKARTRLGWEQAVKAFKEKARVRGRVLSAIKGGFMVDVAGVSAFLPASLADLRPVRNPKTLVGSGVRCLILEVSEDKKQLVLSRKAVLEEEAGKRRRKLMEKLKVGHVIIGRVMHKVPAGVFVNVGGVEGFVPTAELAWKDPEKVLAGVSHGDKMRLKVLRVELETEKITLGIKQFLPNPADALRKKYPAKTTVSGRVAEVKPEGVLIQIKEGVSAFCAAAELQSKEDPSGGGERFHARDPKAAQANILWPHVGDEVKGVVLGVHPVSFNLTVSIRRYEDMQDRKRVAKYLKGAPRLTLGQILSSDGES